MNEVMNALFMLSQTLLGENGIGWQILAWALTASSTGFTLWGHLKATWKTGNWTVAKLAAALSAFLAYRRRPAEQARQQAEQLSRLENAVASLLRGNQHPVPDAYPAAVPLEVPTVYVGSSRAAKLSRADPRNVPPVPPKG